MLSLVCNFKFLYLFCNILLEFGSLFSLITSPLCSFGTYLMFSVLAKKLL
ncbi:unnamed protein product [Brugia timori]|uniref:Uncharacterized protein n=1 Tax=Brugia timori TaxID=42155 RepID=A0A0R3Q3V5_9BILA|nr:unnamed protein product [Brugia timori]